jgi:hypothetical protein
MLHEFEGFAGSKKQAGYDMPSRSARSFIQILEITSLVLFSFLFLVWLAVSNAQTIGTPFAASPTPAGVERLWAQYSTYFPVAKYQPPPRNCKVSQVSGSDEILPINLIYSGQGQHCMYLALFNPQSIQSLQIQRHGSRYPTSGAGIAIQVSVARLLGARNYTDSRLDFLTNYTYELGQDDLVPLGASE